MLNDKEKFHQFIIDFIVDNKGINGKAIKNFIFPIDEEEVRKINEHLY